MEPLTLDSRDVGQVEDFVSKIYSKMRIGAAGGEETRAQITRRVLGPAIGFDDLDYSFEIGYAAVPPDLLIICDVVSNTVRRDGAGGQDQTSETFGPGDQYVISRPGLPYAGVAHAPRLRFTLLDPAIFSQVAISANDASGSDPVRLLDHRPVSRQAQLDLQRTIAYVRDDVMTANQAAPAPLLTSVATQLLAASVLHAYPNTAVPSRAVSGDRDAQPSTVSRAIGFIETNPDLPLTLTDIASAANATPRALQLAFRRHLDTTPAAYLRRVRLDHARDELRCAATVEQRPTVTQVAARWGFTSARFSALYQLAYGERPSQTLRG